jgi:general secretion pathway protein F
MMTRFRYRAVNATGDLIEGEIDGQDQGAVIEQLRRQGHLPLATEPLAAATEDVGAAVLRRLHQPLFGHGRIGRQEVAMITRQLATMLDSGLTIDQTLRFLVDLADREALRRLLTDLLERVQGGSTLADACAEHEEVFSRAYVSLVRAGEAGGALNEVLARLADYLENAERLAEQVKSALVYPIILLVMAGLSIVVLLTVVVPQFTPLFENAGAELPLLTRIVVSVGDLMQQYWWMLLLGAICLWWLARRQIQRPESRARIDRWLLRVPLFGGLLTRIDTARLARTLGTLLANGVPILNALVIARDTIANAALRDAIGETATAVKEGKGVADPLARSHRFPPLAVRLIAVGERSGHLEAMLIKVADIYDAEVRSTVERLMSLLVPALTLSLGAIIATIIGAVLMAILSAYELPL